MLSEPFPFNLMFATSIGPAGTLAGYLRPETAQGIFVNFRRLLAANGGKLPFAAAQIGLAYRNEIAPRGGLLRCVADGKSFHGVELLSMLLLVCFRVREFTMGEIEHFVDPLDKSHPRFACVAGEELTLFTSESQQGSGKTSVMTAGEAALAGIINSQTLAYFMARTQQFLLSAGVKRSGLRFRQHLPSERAHYGTKAQCGQRELWLFVT